jgi:hypothetical protein
VPQYIISTAKNDKHFLIYYGKLPQTANFTGQTANTFKISTSISLEISTDKPNQHNETYI